jgi:hypothetical protein
VSPGAQTNFMELRVTSGSANGNVTGLMMLVGGFVVLAFLASFPVASYYTASQTVVLSEDSRMNFFDSYFSND